MQHTQMLLLTRLECMINNDSKRVTYGEKGSPNTSAACLDFCEVCETGKKFKYMLLPLDRPRVREREKKRDRKPAGESFWKWNSAASRLTDFCLVLRSASTGVVGSGRELADMRPTRKDCCNCCCADQMNLSSLFFVWCRSQDLKMGKFSES